MCVKLHKDYWVIEISCTKVLVGDVEVEDDEPNYKGRK